MKTNLENYEERFVDYMEGQLDDAEMREVEAFVAQHSELEEDFKLFCISKLAPDASIVFAKKDRLMKPVTTVRPIFVRILAAAACIALLIGIGIRFLKPHQEIDKLPMVASLTPIKPTPLAVPNVTQDLRKSNVNAIRVPKTTPKPQETLTIVPFSPIDLIAEVQPIAPKPLQQDEAMTFDFTDTQLYTELGERLAAVEPLGEPDLSFEDQLLGNVRHVTKYLYKKTAKGVMSVYHTADYLVTEAKDQLVASR